MICKRPPDRVRKDLILLLLSLILVVYLNCPSASLVEPLAEIEQNGLSASLLPIYRLFPAGRTTDTVGPDHCPTSEAVDIPTQDHGIAWGYKICRDGTLEKYFNEADHVHRAWSKVYYPPQAGEESRRLEVAAIYAPKTGELVHSERYWWAGTLMQTDHVDATGLEHVVDFAEDGITFLREQLVKLVDCCQVVPDILGEFRWLNIPGHPLVYANIENADHSRTVSQWDEQRHLLEMIQWGPGGIAAGSHGIGYYPGTHTVRFKSETDYSQTLVTYFRPDATKDYDLYLADYNVRVDNFDGTGTKTVVEKWIHRLVQTTGEGIANSVTYQLFQIDLMDSAQAPAIEFHFANDKLTEVRKSNLELNGTHYAEIDYLFDAQQVFVKSKYWLTTTNHLPDRIDSEPPPVDLRSLLTPTMLSIPEIDPDLPVPAATFEH